MGRFRAGLVSGVWVLLLFVAVFGAVLNVPVVGAGGTIYIRADGSIEPTTAPITTIDNITYTFTDNVYDEIVIQRSSTVIEGNGYTLQGSGSGNGFYLSEVNNVTIRNTNIKMFSSGIEIVASGANTISENNITENSGYAIHADSSSFNIISGNNIKNNWGGIGLFWA